MGDIGAVVLLKLLREPNLDAWARLRLAYFDAAYSSIYAAINSFYTKYSALPTFENLLTSTQRDGSLTRALTALQELEVPDVDIDIAVDALIDQFTQNESLKLIDKFVDRVVTLDSQEIKDALADIVLKLDEQTHTSESVIVMNNVSIFQELEANEHTRFPLGFSNTFDVELGGAYRQELILVGGKRGAGKSIVCSNLVANQLDSGNSTVYFTIEMTAKETLERIMAIQSGVEYQHIRKGTLSFEEQLALIKIRASQFQNSEELVEAFREHRNPIKFEQELIRSKQLVENQLVIIDDRELSLTSVDLHLQKLKAKYGDKFKLAVVDYLNQIQVNGKADSMYDWTTQIFISKKLKEFARKYDICIFSPYQIDDSGATRFAKGILDSTDIALLLDAHTKDQAKLTFTTTKIRGGADLKFSVGMDWKCLKINPAEIVSLPEEKEEPKKFKKPKEEAGDLPW